MNVPQIILIVWWAVHLSFVAHRHGKTVTTTIRFQEKLINVLISAAFLWWGGFWK